VEVEIDEHPTPRTPRVDVAPSKQGIISAAGGRVRRLRWFIPRAFAVKFFVILGIWIFQAEGGLGFVESSLFGWHALLMALFVVCFTQEAVLSYSAPIFKGPGIHERTIAEKWFHVGCHVLGIVCAMLGIVAIVYYKNLSPQPIVFPFFAVYSPHSWMGIVVLILWSLQMTAGIYTFIYQSPSNKIMLANTHKFLGKVIYGAGLATCALGLQDMQSSDLASSTPPIPGTFDTLGMGQVVARVGNMTVNITGYYPNSPEAQYSSACTILLLFIGMATFGNLAFKE